MSRAQNEEKRGTANLFGEAARAEGRDPLTVFHAEFLSREQTNWRELLTGFNHLKVITYASGLASDPANGRDVGLELDRAKDGRIAVTATSFVRALKAHQTAPSDSGDDRISRAEIVLELPTWIMKPCVKCGSSRPSI
jgi:hypothetical protein